MALVTSRDYQLTPDVLGAVGSGLQSAGQIQQLQGAAQKRQLTAQTQALTSQILDPQATPQQKVDAQRQLTALNPQAAQQLLTTEQSRVKGISDRETAVLKSVSQTAAQLETLPTLQSKKDFLGRKIAELDADPTRTSEESREILELYESGQIEAADALVQKTIALGERMGFIKPSVGAGGLASAKTEILKDGSVIQALPDGTVQVRNPSGEVVEGQERLDVLSQSRQQAIKTLQTQADIKAAQAGKAETAKLKSQLKLKPQLEAEISKARAIAKDKGEIFTELNQMQAALPGLQGTIESLRELAPIATSTLGGRIFDTAVKETGFGSTKGATARAKFIAVINNQVLPLLKPTFGAAFTVQEGESLKATMGDPNATPEEKMAQLDAFVAQKVRDIESKEAQLQQPEEQNQVLRFDAQGNIIK